VIDDPARCYAALQSRDARFDGVFFVAVTSTHIYCRPSCPARTPHARNCRFYPSAAAAQQAGFRACKRCRPDASPGSPEWRWRGDVVGRALRLIADGVVDREGVGGVARRVGYSERQLERLLNAEVGAGPLAIARAQRARTARVLLESTSMRAADVAFAAGFASVRQFNDTMRDVFAATPTELRARANGRVAHDTSAITLRLAARAPFAVASLLDWLGGRAIPGVETWDGTTYARVLALPSGPATVALRAATDAPALVATLQLDELGDLAAAVARLRALGDLDADPVAVDAHLARDRALRASVARRPGLRVPGAADGFELAVRAVLGQQVSVAGARTLAARLVARCGDRLATRRGDGLTHVFPTAPVLADADLDGLGLTGGRIASLHALAAAVRDGKLEVDAGADRDGARAALLELAGVGPWTAEYVALRALGDPDAFPVSDLGLRAGATQLGLDGAPRALERRAERWRPWRAYAAMHLWSAYAPSPGRSKTRKKEPSR
jgi:AraC family transcriptional regulator of adaptative response / DNA-3-methyladenine glycosylase II